MPILRRSPHFQEALQDTDCNWIHINMASVLCSVIAEAMASAKIELVSIDNKCNYTLWITNCFWNCLYITGDSLKSPRTAVTI